MQSDKNNIALTDLSGRFFVAGSRLGYFIRLLPCFEDSKPKKLKTPEVLFFNASGDPWSIGDSNS